MTRTEALLMGSILAAAAVVVAVIMLAHPGAPGSYPIALERQRRESCKTNIKAIGKAIEMYTAQEMARKQLLDGNVTTKPAGVITYDQATRTLHWSRPPGSPGDSHVVLLIFAKGGEDAIYSNIFDPNTDSITVDEINKKIGPLVPVELTPSKRAYDVVVFLATKEGRGGQVPGTSTAKITIGEEPSTKSAE
jgi:hypothetical protein